MASALRQPLTEDISNPVLEFRLYALRAFTHDDGHAARITRRFDPARPAKARILT
jgi:hypothetical protein